MAIKYTEEQKSFLKSYLPEHTHLEAVEAFNERFPDNPITYNQSRGFAKNYKVHSVTTGKFQKGQQAHNKGKRWDDFMPKESQERSRATCYKKGNRPVSWRPVGSIRMTKDFYMEIKVAEPNIWELFHVYIWEQQNGPVPTGYKVIFKDGNRENCCIDNLMLVTYGELLTLNTKGWKTEHGEITEAYVNLLRLMNKSKEVENGKNK